MRKIGHVGRRPSSSGEAATGERIVAFGRVGKPPGISFFPPFLTVPAGPINRRK
jgi:hypothetical protein